MNGLMVAAHAYTRHTFATSGGRRHVVTMNNPERPALAVECDRGPVDEFVRELQQAIDQADADLFNRRFAADVLWGSPFGAVADGYDAIHAVHARMFASVPAAPGASRYLVEHARFPAPDVAIAYVRRLRVHG